MKPFACFFRIAAASIILLSSAGAANAASIDSRFFGHWVGTGTVTDYVADTPKAMDRNIEVEIKKVGANGFEVRNSLMTTMSDKETRVVAEPTGATAVHQVFEPIGTTGRWAAQKACTDLTKRKGCGWAHVVGSTLVVDVLTVDAKGAETIMSTKRQLTEDGIKVTFRRITDGDLSRVVEGTMKNATP
ncbi:MAG: hypothetical protein JWO51_391 [Rhodospirillales bacterium]|nr:hypothetical protein [Rhodospirillales bacterium]